MSLTHIMMIAAGVALSYCFIIRWKRHLIMRYTCPSELFFLESAKERVRVYGLGVLAFLKDWRTWVAIVGYMIPLGLLAFAMEKLTLDAADASRLSFGWTLLGLYVSRGIVLLLIPIMYVRCRKSMRVFLRQYLNDHGIPICKNCGYDLRGQIELRCPECGTEFERGVTMRKSLPE